MSSSKTQQAVDFLRRVYPNGPWVITAIAVDRKGIETTTFDPSPAELDRLNKWLNYHIGRSNLYWSVNQVMRPVNKKAEREDIKAVCYLHVDIDVPAGTDLNVEKQKILARLRSPSKSVPAPTFIVHSGGGYQAFWKLQTPIEVNGDLQRAEEAKRYNLQLEATFAADNCHNVDRIMRLPGTLNIPDAKKKKKGRVPTMAEVVEWEDSRVYPLSAFIPAPAVQMFNDGFAAGDSEGIKLSGNIKRLDDISELDAFGVPDRTKVIVVQGCLPEEPKQGDNSRSAWLFDCICNLLRCNVPDEMVFSIITDPDFLISGSVIDKGTLAEKYALRQIARAKEEIIEPWLRKLNERHAVIGNFGGKCRVIEEVEDPALGRSKLTKQSFEDFSNRYLNQYVTTGKDQKTGQDIRVPVGKWWLRHTQRRQYDTLTFAPGRDIPGTYNLWKGFACEAIPGDCSAFLEHIKVNICSNNEEHYLYLINWMARAVQKPDSPGQVAIVLRGKQGTGKSFLAKTFGKLFGRHYLSVSDAKHLVGSFNAHLRDTVVLFGEEAFFAGDKRHESVLKVLITEELLTVESKGVDVEVAPNYLHVMLASNSQWVVPAGADERRYFVLDVGDEQKQNSSYFADLNEKMMKQGGLSALLHHLLHLDLSQFNVRQVPKTKALAEQKLLSLAPEEEWWYRKLSEGRLLEEHDDWKSTLLKHELFQDYSNYMKMLNVPRRANETSLGRFLHRMCPRMRTYRQRARFKVPTGPEGWTKEVTRRAYFFELPTLDVCRKKWVELYNTGEEFPAIPEERELQGASEEEPM